MWEFINEYRLPGCKLLQDGNISVELTDDEVQEVEKVFNMFGGMAVHHSVADDFRNGTTSFALCGYAKQQLSLFEMNIETEEHPTSLEKSLAASVKAYVFYELPIYMYDIGCCLEADGKINESAEAFRIFLQGQAEYPPAQIDEAFTKHLDIDQASRNAEAKLAQLRNHS